MTDLTSTERDLLIAALRTHYYQAADIANAFERQWGEKDGRVKEQWTKAKATQSQLIALGKKLGAPTS